nr:unnamed protein product [Spirometra erinaceieuropaei]
MDRSQVLGASDMQYCHSNPDPRPQRARASSAIFGPNASTADGYDFSPLGQPQLTTELPLTTTIFIISAEIAAAATTKTTTATYQNAPDAPIATDSSTVDFDDVHRVSVPQLQQRWEQGR